MTNLAAMRGKVVFLNVWATWCRPCVAELPGIEKLAKAVTNDDVVFVIASNEKPETLLRFLEQDPIDLPFYTFQFAQPEPLRSTAIPATYVLDQAGNVALVGVFART